MSRRRKLTDTTPFDTLRLEGTLFVPELLERAARGEAAHQKEADYAIPKGLKLHDEYGRAYRIAAALWQDFAPQLPRTDLDPAKATHGFVLDLLRQCLGFTDLAPLSAPVQIGDRGFPVTAQALGGRLPVIIAPHNLALDDPDPRFAIHGSGARRKSAHQLAQEFLNASRDCLWAIVTNGRSLRLLRDAETLTRPNFLEFDLETILREGEARYADFSALWRILHASRSDGFQPSSDTCIWEKWKSEGHAQGLRVREGLRAGVTQALLILGRGFLTHPDNVALRQRLHDGTLTKEDYFQQLLRLIYRSLFLFCAEERDLLHTPPPADSENSDFGLRISVARKHYAEGYSLRRLKNRSLRQTALDSHGDLWLSLRIVFRALASGQPRLALPALGGLFAETQCPDLDSAALANRDLLAAMRHLRWSSASGSLTAIDYRNMGPEELGSIYESLLELIPTVNLPARAFGFAGITDGGSTSGNERKTTGSYYTPDSLVQELIKSALDPVIAQTIAENPQNPVAALLSLSVIDPASGSGHFLIAAARRLAEKLAELRAPDGAVRPDDYRHALREVIAHCIYGVDRNPMALELARTALWLEGYEPGQPLSFLDHHLQCGDALLGLTDFAQLRKGIAKDAFTVLSGDHKDTCKALAAANRTALKALETRLANPAAELFDATDLDTALQRLTALEAMPDHTPAEVEAKAAAYTAFLAEAQDSPLAHACDLLVAAYLTPKNPDTAAIVPHTGTLLQLLFPQQDDPPSQETLAHATALCREALVFHWPLRFAHIFGKGGFSCVLGNPPWERIKLQEQEFFATREPLIAEAKNKAERAKRIQWLSEGSLHYHVSQFQSAPPPDRSELALFRQFEKEKRLAEATSAFAHVAGEDGGRFALTGVGDVNTYALFAETIEQIRARSGRAGFIVPTGIATDDSTKAYFSHVAEGGRLARLIDFENREKVFPGIDSRIKFSLLTLGAAENAVFSFFLTQTDQLADERRSFALAPEDFALINPNTRTCPVFRSQADAELTRKIYRRVPVLIREARGDTPEANPWGISFSAMIHMANDSHLFLDAPQPDSLPLYEAKMMHQFDHRWATYQPRTGHSEPGTAAEVETADVSDAQKADPAFRITPRYWVPEREVLARLARAPKAVRDAFRDQKPDAQLAATAVWIEAGHDHDLLGGLSTTTARQRVLASGGPLFEALPPKQADWLTDKALAEARQCPPLTEPELAALCASTDLTATLHHLLDTRSPRWLMGWRDITNATNERTVIASVLPRGAVGNNLPLMLFSEDRAASECAALLGNLCSITLDYVARHKVGGTHLNFFIYKQLPILPADAYSESDLLHIVPHVLELTFTADDLSGWAQDLASSFVARFPQHPPLLADPANPTPFPYNPTRRAQLRAELDARYARLYGLTRAELEYILDPATTHGPDYPSVTFPGLKNNDIKNHGEYRTQRLVLEAWDRESVKSVTVLPAKPHITAAADGLSKKWQDTAFVLLAPNRKLVHNYSLAVWPELIRQMGDDLEFETFRKAYRLLCEPVEFETEGRKILPDIPATWWQSRREKLDAASFVPSLKGYATIGDLKIWREHGQRRIRWTGSLPASPIHEAVDDARIALQIAAQWTDDLDQAEMAEIESLLLTLETA